MYGVPRSSKKSCTVTMFGWLSEPASRDSRTKRRAVDGSETGQRGQLLEGHEPAEIGLPGEIDRRGPAASDLPQ